jgi:hypothetical protein
MNTDELRAGLTSDIAGDVEHATKILGQITRLMAAGEFAAASVQTDYLQGRIKSAERAQKQIAKLERKSA